MAISVSFRTYLLEQMGQIRPISTRPMFGGLTFFSEGRAFALAAREVLYFKVDESNRPDFETRGMGPFLPFDDPARPMQYYEVPIKVLEDTEQLAMWMTKAMVVAAKAQSKAKSKAKVRSRSKSVPPAAPKPKGTRS